MTCRPESRRRCASAGGSIVGLPLVGRVTTKLTLVIGLIITMLASACGSAGDSPERAEPPSTDPTEELEVEDDADEEDEEDEEEEEEEDEDEELEDEEDEDEEDEGQEDEDGAAPDQETEGASGAGDIDAGLIQDPDSPSWQPWPWNGWQKFPSLYFAAEAEGPLDQEQIDKIGRFSLAIIEFRAGQFVAEESSGEWANGDLAGFMEQQASQIRRAHPNGPPVLTYRSGMWAGSMYSKQWQALQDQSLFLEDARLCDGFISYPKDVDESGFDTNLRYCRWDFRNPATQDVYVSLIQDAVQPASAGVFFDNTQSVVCDDAQEYTSLSLEERAQLSEATVDVYRRVFSDLVAAGKYAILSTTNRFAGIGPLVPWETDCPSPEDAIVDALAGIPFARNNEFWMWSLGETAANQIRNTIRETELGIPVVVHMPWFPNDGGCLEGCIAADGSIKTFSENEFLEFGIAAFLVSMGPGSYFGFSDMQSDEEGGGWFDVSWPYYPEYDRIVTGRPLGPAAVSADGTVFTREFERGVVWVNVADGSYEIDL